jgi:hypothetical protein
MRLPEPPDLGRPRWRLALTALAVTVVVGVVLGFRDGPGLSNSLGDTDDAMRVVLVRGLLHGTGWWDQHLMRLQPPIGVYMHWSRLLDGGIAGLESLFALVVDWPRAEWLTRLIWPVLWIFPAVSAMMLLADRLSERTDETWGVVKAPGAVMIVALFFLVDYTLYLQFHPGRVDHHDVQMTFCFLALAGAAQRGPSLKGPILAGVATGLGLAIGLEALLFEAAIGAAVTLRFVFDARHTKSMTAYGMALAGTALLAFCIQTPPWRWTTAACDALAFNSVAAVAVAGLAVAAIGRFTAARPSPTRFIALAGAAILTASVYLGLDPRCIKGPFADVDPAIKSLWLVHVQEMRPWLVALKRKPEDAIVLAAAPVMALIALIWLGRRKGTRQDSAYRLTAGLLLMTSAAGFGGVRMSGYADWIAMPLIAAAAADAAQTVAARYKREGLIVAIMAGLIAMPVTYAEAASWATKTVSNLTQSKPAKKNAPEPPDHCFQNAPYRALAKAGPPGLVLDEIDLGPVILANSADSVLAAPYHRMSWGMLAARSVWSANADDGAAEARARALGIGYVVECKAHRRHADRMGLGETSLMKRLDADGHPPDWLERLNPPGAPVEVFRVRPPSTTPQPPAG